MIQIQFQMVAPVARIRQQIARVKRLWVQAADLTVTVAFYLLSILLAHLHYDHSTTCSESQAILEAVSFLAGSFLVMIWLVMSDRRREISWRFDTRVMILNTLNLHLFLTKTHFSAFYLRFGPMVLVIFGQSFFFANRLRNNDEMHVLAHLVSREARHTHTFDVQRHKCWHCRPQAGPACKRNVLWNIAQECPLFGQRTDQHARTFSGIACSWLLQ